MNNDRQLISVPAQVMNMNPKADRSWKLVFETRELKGDEVKLLADNFQGEGWLLFSPNDEIALADVPEERADSGVKTSSKRLRDVIFILWQGMGGKGDFESFYRTYMQKLIEYVQSKIPEEG
jgi:hypothetical protein